MSGSITGTSATASTSATSGTGSSSAADSLGTLTSNFSTFLQLLMTQLQNQDPTSPMDTSQFTTELVQFSGVEQQINTNSNLNTLIQLQQGSQVEQATAMVGDTVTATSSQLALSGGTATTVGYTAPGAETVDIVVSNSLGNELYAAQQQASSGSNSWKWNGENDAGTQLPDGIYNVTVTANNGSGGSNTLATTVTGKATGVTQQGTTVQLQIGNLPVKFGNVTNVSTAGSSS